MYTTKEVASMLNITTRTVRYYDNENIVNASDRKHTHRYYTPEKVTILFIVLFLKKLGYNLSKIKSKLESTENIQCLLQDAVEDKEQQITEDIQVIGNVKEMINYYSKHNVTTFSDMTQLEQSKRDILEEHLTQDELNIIQDISKIQHTHHMNYKWPVLIEKVRVTHNYREHVDEWFQLLSISFQGRFDIITKLWYLEETYQLNFSEMIDENIKKNMRQFLYEKIMEAGHHVYNPKRELD